MFGETKLLFSTDVHQGAGGEAAWVAEAGGAAERRRGARALRHATRGLQRLGNRAPSFQVTPT